MDIDIIYPLIVPSRYYDERTWNLPHETFPNKEYILTWVFFRGEGSMSYIRQDEFKLLNKSGQNWQQRVFENLRDSGEYFYTSFRKDSNTGSLSFIIFSNEDGIGSSRILLSHELRHGFPEGYYVSIPDRAIGIAVSKKLSLTERKALEDTINDYYGCSGTAMSKAVLEPSDFLLPDIWTQPIDREISDWMIGQIHSPG